MKNSIPFLLFLFIFCTCKKEPENEDCKIFWEEGIIGNWVAVENLGHQWGCNGGQCHFFELSIDDKYHYTLNYKFYTEENGVFLDSLIGIQTGIIQMGEDCKNSSYSVALPSYYNPDGISGVIHGKINFIPDDDNSDLKSFRYERDLGSKGLFLTGVKIQNISAAAYFY